MSGHNLIQTQLWPAGCKIPHITISKKYLGTQKIQALWSYGNIYIISNGCAFNIKGFVLSGRLKRLGKLLINYIASSMFLPREKKVAEWASKIEWVNMLHWNATHEPASYRICLQSNAFEVGKMLNCLFFWRKKCNISILPNINCEMFKWQIQ